MSKDLFKNILNKKEEDLFKNILNKKGKTIENITTSDFETLDLNKKSDIYAWATYWSKHMKNSKGEW